MPDFTPQNTAWIQKLTLKVAFWTQNIHHGIHVPADTHTHDDDDSNNKWIKNSIQNLFMVP